MSPLAPPSPPPPLALFDSHIFGTELMAIFDQLEVLQSNAHDLWTWLSVVAVPGSKAGDDPSRKGKCSFWVRVFLTLRLAFEVGRKSFQERLVARIKRLLQHLIRAAVASPHQLQDDDACDSDGAD